MKGPIGFGRVVNLVMNIILGLCMSLVMLTAAGVPLLPEIVIELGSPVSASATPSATLFPWLHGGRRCAPS